MAVKSFNEMTPAEQENQRKYIQSLVSGGTKGQAEWARQYAVDNNFDIATPIVDTSNLSNTFVNKSAPTIDPQVAEYNALSPEKKAEQKTYIQNLINTGSIGQARWAQEYAEKTGIDLSSPPTSGSVTKATTGAPLTAGTSAPTTTATGNQTLFPPSENKILGGGLTIPQMQAIAPQQQQIQQPAFDSTAILDFIRRGSEEQKRALTDRIKAKINEALFRVEEEGVMAEERFGQAIAQEESRGRVSAKRLIERLATKGITGGQETRILQEQERQTRGRVAGLETQRTSAFLERSRLMNQIRSAGADELSAMLSEVDADTMSQIVNQMNEDRRFQLSSEVQRSQLLTQQLDNVMAQLEIQAFPEKLALEMENLRNKVESGKLSLDELRMQTEMIADPDSYYNVMRGLDLRLKNLDIENANATLRKKYVDIENAIRGVRLVTDPNEELRLRLDTLQLQDAITDLEQKLGISQRVDDGISRNDVVNWLNDLAQAGSEAISKALASSRTKELIRRFGLEDMEEALRKQGGFGNF